MQKHITPNSIANEIRMLRPVFAGSFLIVEGSIDSRVYGNFVSDNCQIKIAFNKDNATDAIEILNEDSFVGVLSIVDADFDILEEKEHETENLFLTNFHDLECGIISSPALEKVLAEFGSEGKIKKIEKIRSIRDLLFEIGSLIGCLRWISLSEKLNLKFEDLKYSKFLKKENLRIEVSELVKRVIINSPDVKLDEKKVTPKVNSLMKEEHDKYHICCGKDLIEILSIAFQKVLGTNNSNDVKYDIIARDLRLAYEFEFFTETELYGNIKKWEEQNKPFEVFR